MGMGAVGLANTIATAFGADAANSLAAHAPHFAPKAKRVIHFFLNGGPSHVDTFDPKPALAKYAGQPLPNENLRTERKTGAAFPSPFAFQRYGQSGLEISELFAKTAQHADRIAVVRSMVAQVPNHEPSLMLMNCGDSVQARPSVGSWVLYGLGTENQNLPGFITICPTLGHGGVQNWSSAFLPAEFQGTPIGNAAVRAKDATISHLASEMPDGVERAQLDLLAGMNREQTQVTTTTPLVHIYGAKSRIVEHRKAGAPSPFPAGLLEIEIPDSHHHIMIDQPLALVSALRALLSAWPR